MRTRFAAKTAGRMTKCDGLDGASALSFPAPQQSRKRPMKSLKHCLCVLLLFATVTFAQAPAPTPTPSIEVAQVVLKMPEKAKVGELVIIDASDSVASQFVWRIGPETKDFLVIENGKRLVFSARASGEFNFTVAVAYKDTVDVQIRKLVITGVPSPTDDISSKVAQWCSLVQSNDTKAEAKRLANSFESIAAFAASGVLDSPAAVLAATKKANQDALGDDAGAWTPFFEQLKTELISLAEAGKLPDTQAHAAAWRAIAEGLNAFAEG